MPKLCVNFPEHKKSQIYDAVKRLRKSKIPLLPGVIEKLFLRKISNKWHYYHQKVLIRALLKHGVNYKKLFQCIENRTIGAIKTKVDRLLKELRFYEKKQILSKENAKVLHVITSSQRIWGGSDKTKFAYFAAKYGKDWVKLGKEFPHRTRRQISSHWYKTC